ncbi:hypothetical protein ACFWPK_22335 [Nocardia sp. NPDC058519]|uniref:hypothetical protein n=1 Tax=Nocardia sp. NPDC058519 TaxID=3346535 RepID=UPI003668D8F1
MVKMADAGIEIGSGGPGAGVGRVWHPPTAVVTAVGVLPHRLVRVWDLDWTFMSQLAGDLVKRDGDSFTAALPIGHEVARWLNDNANESKGSRLTVDDGGLRWAGVLDGFTITRVGACPECEHCRQPVMEIRWSEVPAPPQGFAMAGR